MEAIEGACFLDGEWESLYKIFSNDNPDVEFSHLLGHNSQFLEDNLGQDEGLMNLLVGDQFCSEEAFVTANLNESTSDSSYTYTLNQLTQLLNHDDQFSDFLVDNGLLMDQDPNNDDSGSDDHRKRKCTETDETPLPKKRARVSKQGEKKGKSTKKNKKDNVELVRKEDTNGGQRLSFDISDNESNASQEEAPKEILNLNGKKRASRGAATDPQSLYARKRRERINERLRILQKLVPNGTKVDISTMLEEAVHYVKFLQLQIKLLSSDEMWMYAPLAYNGFDVGIYERFSSYY